MNLERIQIAAGLVSSVIFSISTLTMLLKTVRTKNVDSFSLSSLALSNVGNMMYWLYIVSLPCGPIHLLHSFYTVAMVIMLVFYLGYHNYTAVKQRITLTMQAITTKEMRAAPIRCNPLEQTTQLRGMAKQGATCS